METPMIESKTAPRYGLVFAVLAIFTVLEAVTAYLPSLPGALKIAILAFLAIVKVALVLLYFMHLKFDNKIFALPFALGVVLVIPLLLIVTLASAAAPVSAEAAGLNTAGQVVDVKEVSFRIKLSQYSANAGPVTFHIVNGADDVLHEFIIIQTDNPPDELPTDPDGRVSEDAVTIITAAEDIPPSNSRNLTVNLAAGKYVMICNLPGHYQQGMRVGFTVTGASNEPPSTPESTPSPTQASGGSGGG